MKKRLFFMIMIVAIMVNPCMAAVAADNPTATKNGLSSRGSICYQEGQETVVIDSEDLYTLADRLDLFKARVVERLGAMYTYLSKDSAGVPLGGSGDVYAVHKEPSPENAVDPLTLDFDVILQGIEFSQSIPSDPSVYGLPSDVKLYIGKDGRLLTAQTNGATPTSIRKATAANLSAGTAAWVDGEPLLGTGEDMATMYNNMSSGGELGTYNISSGYTLPVDVVSAYAYVVTWAHADSGEDGNTAGEDPYFTVNGGRYKQLYANIYARNGFNVRVALYHVMNAPAGTVVAGSNGLLFY